MLEERHIVDIFFTSARVMDTQVVAALSLHAHVVRVHGYRDVFILACVHAIEILSLL